MMTDKPVRPVPTTFSRRTYQLTQVWRSGMVAIYEQRLRGVAAPISWEVVRLRVAKAHLRDKDQSPKEAYPPHATWGTRGWTYRTLEQAQVKAALLTSRQ